MFLRHLLQTDEKIRDWIASFVRERQQEDVFRDYKAELDTTSKLVA